VNVAITDRVYVKHHRRIGDQLGTSIPRGAFSGATLDLLLTGEVDKLDEGAREHVLDFAEDFLDCDCDSNPYCGHPERKFVRYLLEQRATGLSPEAIVDSMDAEYGLYAYPGDLLSFLDDAVRTLEAAASLADVENHDESLRELEAARDELLGAG
jgi:superfamily II helicase